MADTGAAPLPPTPPARTPVSRAEQFVWLSARVLERRRFEYHFLGGGADAVETALAAYRNEDDGYGHALEPDLRGPASRPLHVGHALRVLDSIGRCGGPRVQRVCRYLTSVSTREGALPAVRPGLHDRPGAPFSPVVDGPPGELLATGPVVGLLHRNEVWHAWLFRATDFCWQAVASLEKTHPYEVGAAVAFLDHAPDRPRAEAAADRLGRLVRGQRLAVLDPEDPGAFPAGPGHTPGEYHLPHDYARTPGSLARAWFTDEEMARSLRHLKEEQQEDGGWPVHRRRWAPGAALEAPPAATEARSVATIEALRTLQAYGLLT